MSTSSTSSRRRILDLPKNTPDTGLAEWTSRVKAIQQAVDRDEETEQRKLQDEIVRSRMERARRRNTATGSIDWSSRVLPSPNEASEDARQPDATLKAADSTNPYSSSSTSIVGSVPTTSQNPKPENISLAAFIGGRATGPKLNKHAPQQDSHDPALFDQMRREGPHPIFGIKNESVLGSARFPSFGLPKDSEPEKERYGIQATQGRESIDRLRDTSPTSLEASVKNLSTVREVVTTPITTGKLVGQEPPSTTSKPSVQQRRPPEIPDKPLVFRKPSNTSLTSNPSTQTRAHVGAEPKDKAPTPVFVALSRIPPNHQSDVHGLSTQTQAHVGAVPKDKATDHSFRSSVTNPPKAPTPDAHGSKESSNLIVNVNGKTAAPRINIIESLENENLSVGSQYVSESRWQALPGMQRIHSPTSPVAESPNMSPTPSEPESSPGLFQPGQASDEHISPIPSSKRTFSGSKVTTPSLARLVQPRANVQPSPIATASSATSPAFLRSPPSTQELHPSLSRLQGRGFVEKRIKASAVLSQDSNAQTQQRERNISPNTSNRKPSVLDRWQHIVPPSVPSSPLADKLQEGSKPAVLEESSSTPRPQSVQQVIRPRPTPTAVRIPDQGSRELPAPVRLPGLARPESLPQQGPQVRSSDESHTAEPPVVKSSSSILSVGKNDLTTLSHPTRHRARKPRKAQETEIPRNKSPTNLSKSLEPGPAVGDTHGVIPMADQVDGNNIELLLPAIPITGPHPSTSAELRILKANDEEIHEDSIAPKYNDSSSDLSSASALSSVFAGGTSAVSDIATPVPVQFNASHPIIPISPRSSPEQTPASPSRHTRIPSSGQRATVMDVAQALKEHEQHIRESSMTPEPEDEDPEETIPLPSGSDAAPEEVPQIDVKAVIAGWGRNIATAPQPAERRRSMYDRYPVATLPPLAEEKTPVSTPQGTLSRSFPEVGASTSASWDVNSKPQKVDKDLTEGVTDTSPNGATEEVFQTNGSEIPPTVSDTSAKEIRLDHNDKPPPGFNLQSLLKEVPYYPDPRTVTISVEVFSISGHIATAVTREPNVFYDSEVMAVVHRAKEKTDGLVSTKVYVWTGKEAELGEKEDRKVNELAGRFNTHCAHCEQGSEPPELIHHIGGVLAIRQGQRAHWSVENTSMHRIHRIGDSIFVDEIDFAIHNLCSAYSYCLSILDALYIWHGRGSSEDERKVASAYGQSLATQDMKIDEFEEGEEDEMFWMMLGDDGYANAYCWKFKSLLDRLGPRLYKVDSNRHKAPVQAMQVFSGRDLPHDGVFVVDCRFELFIVVARTARGKRVDIQLALFLAENISATAGTKLPFDPPVHVVILPSRLPLELRAAIRMCDELGMNEGSIPDHMNLLPLPEALDHMQRRIWPMHSLSDIQFLPLGVDPCML